MPILIVLTTLTSEVEAQALGEQIVAAKLAGCVQILTNMTSIYVWEGQLQKDKECLLLIKTLPEKYGKIEEFIQLNHSYEVPEIIAIESANVSDAYCRWLEKSLASPESN